MFIKVSSLMNRLSNLKKEKQNHQRIIRHKIDHQKSPYTELKFLKINTSNVCALTSKLFRSKRTLGRSQRRRNGHCPRCISSRPTHTSLAELRWVAQGQPLPESSQKAEGNRGKYFNDHFQES